MAEANELEKSWYTKYRPKTIEEYCGDNIKEVVKRRFTKRSNMPHVIMISGHRGTGKTTFARIISKYYLCQNPHDDGTPCEQCEMCQSINEILINGNSTEVECPGVTELDATVMNGKEAIQSILDDALQAPLYGDFKVLIVDECHMISNAAQNSMLKVIEDIPKWLIVIYATTDPQKVLQTIKSRCQLTLEAKKQSLKDMVHRLLYISKMEGLEVSEEALRIVAKHGDRVPRECINILESIAKTYGNRVLLDTVRHYLGGVSSELYMDYFRAANNGLSDILVFIKRIKKDDVKYTEFVKGLTNFVLDSMYVKHGISHEEYPKEYVEAIKELFDVYNSSDFDMLLQVIEMLYNSISSTDDTKNELLLTITAMRISKIDLLANGLANEQSEAIKENKLSLYEHSKKLQLNRLEVSEKLKMSLDIESMNENFENIETVSDFDEIPNIELKEIEEVEKPSDKNADIGIQVDEFFSFS